MKAIRNDDGTVTLQNADWILVHDALVKYAQSHQRDYGHYKKRYNGDGENWLMHTASENARKLTEMAETILEAMQAK